MHLILRLGNAAGIRAESKAERIHSGRHFHRHCQSDGPHSGPREHCLSGRTNALAISLRLGALFLTGLSFGMRHQRTPINHIDLLTFVGLRKHVQVKSSDMIRTTSMATPVPALGIHRTTRKRMVGAMEKLTVLVSSVLLAAIITVTFSMLDPSLF